MSLVGPVDISRSYLPLAMAVGLGVALLAAGFGAGNFISSLQHDKRSFESRLAGIEKEILGLKDLIARCK